MEEIGRQPPAKFTKKKILGFFTTWHIWFLTPCNLPPHQFLSESPLPVCDPLLLRSVYPRMS